MVEHAPSERNEADMSYEQLHDFLRQRAAQFEHLRDADIWQAYQTWSRDEQHQQPVRFHASRMTGIGGSDAGVILADYRNQPHPFSNVEQLAREKLLRNVMIEPSYHAYAGNLFEEAIRQFFYYWHRASPDEQMQSRDAWPHGDQIREIYPWMNGREDDIVRVRGARMLVDYKHSEPDRTLPLHYRAQLHHYAMQQTIAWGADHPSELFDSLGLAYYDGKRIHLRTIAIDDELMNDLVEANDRFWGYVMRGEVAPNLRDRAMKPHDIPDHQMGTIQKLNRELMALQAQKDAVAEREEQVKKSLIDELRTRRDPDGSVADEEPRRLAQINLPVRFLHTQVKTSLDEDRVKEVLERHQVPIEEVSTPSPKADDYDMNALFEAFRELGGDPEQFRCSALDEKLAVSALEQLGYDPKEFLEESKPIIGKPRRKEEKAAFEQLRPLGQAQIEQVTQALSEAALDGLQLFDPEIEEGEEVDEEPLSAPTH